MLIVNNKALKITNKWLNPIAGSGPTPGPTPPGPTPTLPAYTLRLKYNNGVVPTIIDNKGTLTQVSSSPNIWDWTYENPDWSGNDFRTGRSGSIVPNMSVIEIWNSETSTYTTDEQDTVIEVIGGNTTGVTNMSHLFAYNTNITTLPLLDTSSVTNMDYFVCHCARLEHLPLFDTHNVTSFNWFTAILHYTRDIDVYGSNKWCSNKLKSIPNFDISSIAYTTRSGHIAPSFDGMFGNTPWMEDAQSLQTMFDKLYARFPTYDSDALDSVAPLWDTGYYKSSNQQYVYPNAQVQAVVESIPATWKKYHS